MIHDQDHDTDVAGFAARPEPWELLKPVSGGNFPTMAAEPPSIHVICRREHRGAVGGQVAFRIVRGMVSIDDDAELLAESAGKRTHRQVVLVDGGTYERLGGSCR